MMLGKKLNWIVCAFTPVVVLSALLSQVSQAGAQAAAPAHSDTARVSSLSHQLPDRLVDPGRVLPAGWAKAQDKAVTVVGDTTGLHVLAADEAEGYSWHTVATLGVQGTDTAQWIGQACVTGGGRRAVVAYAPAQITNTPGELDRGALAAVVDLATGKVTPIGAGVSIAYFDPGCGTGQDAVFTQGGWGTDSEVGRADVTRLMMVNAATGKIIFTAMLPGEVASAVPYQGRIAAVYGSGIVSIGPHNQLTTLAKTVGTPFRLVPDSAGGLGFQVVSGRLVQVRRYDAGRDQLLGTTNVGSVDLSQIGGHVFATGPGAVRIHGLPVGWRALKAPALAQVSSTGALAVLASAGAAPARGQRPSLLPGNTPGRAQPVRVSGWLGADGKSVSFTVPAASQPVSRTLPPPLPGFPSLRPAETVPQRATGRGKPTAPEVSPPPNADPATTTYDPDRSCSVPRNDPGIETYQPDDEQIEWATDEAVRGDLTDSRGPDLDGSGLPKYAPQGSSGLFPEPAIDGDVDGTGVPPQVMLGIETQESDLYQASDHVIIGEAGNFEPSSSWYGDNGDYTYVDWVASDCGYGIAQVTSGMCLAGYVGCSDPLPYEKQLAVAVDYQANIAAGVQILVQKWNQLYSQGIIANDGQPNYIEDWYFALWDYNSGMEPDAANGGNHCTPGPHCTDKNGDWGLGWANNPANDAYPPDRPSFLNSSTAQAPDGGSYLAEWEMAHPQYWPYQEKVIGWAFDAFSNWNFLEGKYVQAYTWGIWPSGTVAPAIAPYTTFCTSDDHCDPGDVLTGSVSDTANPCQLAGEFADHCWWHWPASWADCEEVCGTGFSTYASTATEPPYPGVPPGYPPVCTSDPLPKSAVIVGDTASSIPSPLGCGKSWTNNGGTMTWNFGSATGTGGTTYPSKIDFHQIAAGYGGHFWFTHTLAPAQPVQSAQGCITPSNPALEVTGTWTPPANVQGWTSVWAAIPNVGAQAPDAMYQITTGSGQAAQLEIVNQDEGTNSWVNLGEFDLGAGANVALNNVTCNGGTESDIDIAWDAMAFIPSHPLTADYVAMGDSYSSGEGVSPYYPGTDTSSDTCHRSPQAYPTLVTLPGQKEPIAKEASSTSGVSFSFIACSGAITTGITQAAVDAPPTQYDEDGNTNWGSVQSPLPEGLQDEQGVLSPATTLVTLSIGGNDARFADIFFGCLSRKILACSNPKYVLTRHSNHAKDPGTLTEFEPKVIQDLLPAHLSAVYLDIHKLAPNAEIIVVGYPLLFPSGTTSTCKVGTIGPIPFYLSAQNQNWLNETGTTLDNTIEGTVSGIRENDGVDIHFVDPNPAFSSHTLCSSDPWILPLSGFTTKGGSLSLLNPGSFHPNQAGQTEYADLVNGCLAGTVSC
jgi:hypothetical protein